MNLYQINGKVAELKDKYEAGMIDDDVFSDTLQSLDDSRYDKLNNVTNWRQENEVKIDALDKKIKAWKDEKKHLQNTNKHIDGYIMDDLKQHDQKSFTLEDNLVKLRNTKGKVIVDDESKVPSDYVKTKTTKSVDKASAYKELKNGQIDGMHLEPNQSLNIK